MSGPADALADQLVVVIGLGDGEVAHGEVVDDQDGWLGQAFEAAGEAVIGVTSGELGQKPAGGDEGGVVSPSAGLVGQGGGQVRLADADRTIDTQPFTGGDELQPGQIADLGGGKFGV